LLPKPSIDVLWAISNRNTLNEILASRTFRTEKIVFDGGEERAGVGLEGISPRVNEPSVLPRTIRLTLNKTLTPVVTTAKARVLSESTPKFVATRKRIVCRIQPSLQSQVSGRIKWT